MKIGILTFWWSNDNYGQLLQCYALQKYLRDMGHDAFLIRYNWETDVKSTFVSKCLKALNPIKLTKFFAYKVKKNKLENERKRNDRHFDDFREKYIKMSDLIYPTYQLLKDNPPEADMYIVGSDQVWNYWFTDTKRFYSQIHAYFLDFGKKDKKRVSYAASWGGTSISDETANILIPLLKRFDYVSVRETDGIKLCSLCGRKDAEWVCDPTLLLSADNYRKLYNENCIRKIEKKYLLLYMLNNTCDFDIQKVYDFAGSRNLEVVYVTGNGVIDNRQKYFASIPEWLYLVDNAEYVITNSFHCAVFSIIFNKKNAVIPLSGRAVAMNVRFDSLFDVFKIRTRYLRESDFSVLDEPYNVEHLTVSSNFLQLLINK